jgi:hypothetical protein
MSVRATRTTEEVGDSTVALLRVVGMLDHDIIPDIGPKRRVQGIARGVPAWHTLPLIASDVRLATT